MNMVTYGGLPVGTSPTVVPSTAQFPSIAGNVVSGSLAPIAQFGGGAVDMLTVDPGVTRHVLAPAIPGQAIGGLAYEPQRKSLRFKPVQLTNLTVAIGGSESVELGPVFDIIELRAFVAGTFDITTPDGDVVDLSCLCRKTNSATAGTSDPQRIPVLPAGTYTITNVSGVADKVLDIVFYTYAEV